MGQSGQDGHDNGSLEAVIDLPEIMVLKIRTNEISVSTKILFKCLRSLEKLKDLNLPKTNDLSFGCNDAHTMMIRARIFSCLAKINIE